MELNWKALATEVVESLSVAESEEAIAYIEQRVIPAGEEIPWPGITRSFDEPIVIAFIDLEPELNWTHRARYLVLNSEGRLRQIIEVDRPPFLTGVSPDLRVIHRGNKAPEWAVITPTSVK